MRGRWTLGTVITVSFLMLGWLFVRSYQVSDSAQARAATATINANDAIKLASENRVIIDQYIKAEEDKFRTFEEREKERHEAVLSAIKDLRQDVRVMKK